LLSSLFVDTSLTMFLFTICANSWCIYYININTLTTPAPQSTDVKKPSTIELTRSMHSVLIGATILMFIIMNIIFISNNNAYAAFYDTIYLSNSAISYLQVVSLILLIIIMFGLSLYNQNITFSMEYIIFVIIIIFASYLLISSTNLFLTIFLIEFIALLIFGKMAISRVMIKKSRVTKINSFNATRYSYGLFNALFFQF